jgi:hypothetical protein
MLNDQLPQGHDPMVTEKVRKKLERDLRFLSFSLLPGLSDFRDDHSWMAMRSRVSESEATEWRDLLIRSGFWVLDRSASRLVLAQRQGDLEKLVGPGSSLGVFLSLIAQISSRIDPDEPGCWYEVMVQTTNEEVYRDFRLQMGALIREFIDRSDRASADRTVAVSLAMIETNS